MSSYMLIHGDCMDSFGLIHDHSVNLVLADPPYGITQNTWDVVLPFDDFIECDGKNLNYEKYLLHCFKKNIPYKDANEEWNKRKQQGIWSQLDRILADRGSGDSFLGRDLHENIDGVHYDSLEIQSYLAEDDSGWIS